MYVNPEIQDAHLQINSLTVKKTLIEFSQPTFSKPYWLFNFKDGATLITTCPVELILTLKKQKEVI